MAQTLGSVAVGSIVKINESGSPVEFYVAKHDYESGLNGAGRTLMVRKDIYEDQVWDTGNVNAYATSDIDAWFNGTYKNLLDSDIQTAIGTTKFYYTPGNGNNTVGTLERAIFALSITELGESPTGVNTEGSALPIASTLQIAYRNGSETTQWTRSPSTNSTHHTWWLSSDGGVYNSYCSNTNGSRPAFTLPAIVFVLDDGSISVAPSAPSAINVPDIGMQGNSLSVSRSAVDGADGYILERKADTDADWVQVYSGANLTFSETAGTWTSVQYRVKAGVSGTYGDYTTSASVPVVSASAVAISGSDENLGTLVNDVSYTVSSDGTNPLTVTEIINGTTARTFTATNGANNKISVMDLPTGTGTIKITASTNPGSGVVTVTRNWTYTKTAPTFANTGSTAQLFDYDTKENIFPLTLLECVRGAENLAPGGFGLGTVAVNISDLNDATKNGWYMNGAGGEAVHAPDNVPGWLVLVCAYTDEVVFQTAYRYGSDEGLMSARRSYHYLFGGWQPWEWINPPTLLGVEYRTVERYNSKPVYAKAVNFGALPANSSKSVAHGISDMATCFEIVGSYGIQNLVGEAAITTAGANTENITIATDRNLSAESAIVLMKYTKTTD